jgi:hypothetical protein
MPAAERTARPFPAFFLLCYIVRKRAIPIFAAAGIADSPELQVLLAFLVGSGNFKKIILN